MRHWQTRTHRRSPRLSNCEAGRLFAPVILLGGNIVITQILNLVSGYPAPPNDRRIMTSHKNKAHPHSAVPISSAMKPRNTGLCFVKHAGYKITDAMTTGGQKAGTLNCKKLPHSPDRGSHRKQQRNAQNRARPIRLCLGGGAPDAGFGEETMESSSSMTFAIPPNVRSHWRPASELRCGNRAPTRRPVQSAG